MKDSTYRTTGIFQCVPSLVFVLGIIVLYMSVSRESREQTISKKKKRMLKWKVILSGQKQFCRVLAKSKGGHDISLSPIVGYAVLEEKTTKRQRFVRWLFYEEVFGTRRNFTPRKQSSRCGASEKNIKKNKKTPCTYTRYVVLRPCTGARPCRVLFTRFSS